MKTIFIDAAVAAMMAVSVLSCEKNNSSDDVKNVNFSVSFTDGTICDAETKAAGTVSVRSEAEKKINNVQVFVFNKDGEIDNCKRYTGGSDSPGRWSMPEPLECTTGEKDVWVVVNAGEDYTVGGTVTDKASLLAKTVLLGNMDTDGNVANLVMTGHNDDVMFTASGDIPFCLEMTVSRLVCAVSLNKVQNLFQNANYRDKVSITGAFLMQAPGIQRIDGSIEASSTGYGYSFWYARHTKEDGNNILTDVIAETPVGYGESNAYRIPHTFYCFSNDYGFELGTDPEGAVLNDGTDKKSSTYLVVEAKVNGKPYYYPVVLPKLYPNKKYNVSLTIAHLGSRNPWEKVTFTEFKPSITVTDWENKSYEDII